MKDTIPCIALDVSDSQNSRTQNLTEAEHNGLIKKNNGKRSVNS